MRYTTRILKDEDFEEASKLMFRSFYRYVLPTYTMEGVEFFRDVTSALSLSMNTYDKSIVVYGCFDGEKLCGVIARKGKNHVLLYFADERYVGRAVGRALFGRFLKTVDPEKPITVNSTDFAVPIYEHYGFVATGKRRCENGVTYTPMKKAPIGVG